MPGKYLRDELYRQVQSGPELFDFLEAGPLDGVWLWNVENPQHQWYSPRFCALLGFTSDEVPNDSGWWQKRIHPDDLASVREQLAKHRDDPEFPYDQTVRYLHKDGPIVWVRCQAFSIRDASGRAIRMLGAHTDVTQYKRSENRLATDYAELYDASPDMHVSVDAKTALIKVCNRTVAENTGYTKQELVGMPVFDLYHPECLPMVQDAFRTFVETGRVDNAELTLACKNGAKIPVLLSVRAIRNDAGEIVQSISTWRDMRLTKRAAALELLKIELEQSNKELEQFAYVAAHDLQEPLRMVASYCELLAADCGEKLDDEQNEYLKFAVDGARRMKQMIVDILRLARVRSEGTTRDEVDLNEVLDDVKEQLAAQLIAAEATVEFEQLPVVRADRTQMSQVFLNLIGNAVKFRSDRPAMVRISARNRATRCEISVADNGIGIAPEYHDRVLEPFQRLHSRRAYPGTGIGLAIVSRVVQRHGGQLWIESRPDGTTFHFSLPHA